VEVMYMKIIAQSV